MRKVIVSTCAAAMLLVTACSSDNAVQGVKTDWSETEIVEQMGLGANREDTGWTLLADDGQSCTIERVLTSPKDVQSAENAGELVAVNAAGSAGVTIASDDPESCLDAATKVLAELE